MYDLPELEPANEALLAALATLAREDGLDVTPVPITQICGYPLQTDYRGQFTVLGIPAYSVPGCEGPAHRSFIVVSSISTTRTPGDLRGARFAVNSLDSNTGMNLPRHVFAKIAGGKPFFGDVIVTGSHHASMDAVARGEADAAAIDCVTFGLHADYNPAAVAGLRVLARTQTSPGIPFVTPRATGRRARKALRGALRTFSDRADFAPLRRALRIERIAEPSEAAFDILLDYAAESVALGYPQLA